jgi:NAD(P)-dependent dehydrogenase (short-subunit alcohol dehydrogenase family)
MLQLTGKKIVIIGGSSGIGYGIAQACAQLGAKLVIASRDLEKLNHTKHALGANIETHQLDITHPDQIKSFMERIGKLDHLVTPGANVSWGSFGAMSEKDEQASFQSKYWGQYYAAKFGFRHINPGGSIIFFAGCWSQRPLPGAAIPGSINGAIESLARALAVEIAPIRVNVISPGIIDTPVFSSLSEQERHTFFDKTAKGLPLKKIGTPEEIAMTAVYLMSNTYTTGSTLYVDGGETLR